MIFPEPFSNLGDNISNNISVPSLENETNTLKDDINEYGDYSESEYEEETTYLVLDLGTEVTLDMITTNDSLIKNIYNPTYQFTTLSTNFPTQPPNEDNSKENNDHNDNNEGNGGIKENKDKDDSENNNDNDTNLINVQDDGSGQDVNAVPDKEEITYSLIGLDTDNPRLRIGNMHFKGVYDESVGTDIIFLQNPDPTNPRQQKLDYYCHTTKKLIFSRVSLQSTSNTKKLDDIDQWEDEYYLKGDRTYWDDVSQNMVSFNIDKEKNPPVNKGKNVDQNENGNNNNNNNDNDNNNNRLQEFDDIVCESDQEFSQS